jgi:hypothetical protein
VFNQHRSQPINHIHCQVHSQLHSLQDNHWRHQL